jgi:EAL domain-containing protein (putative c-di-GMP-specific phosphodiesterase class I)
MNNSLDHNGLDPRSASAPPVGVAAPVCDTGLCVLRGSLVPEGSVQNFLVAASPYRIGRRPDNHLCLGNPTVSGYHAQIVQANQRLLIQDLGSTNGTFLNGNRVSETAEIGYDDLLQFGTVRFEVLRHCDASAGATLCADVAQQALADLQFTRLLYDPAVEPYYQPIVRLQDGSCIGFEVLARSRLVGLETPANMFRVATARRMEVELSQLLRHEGIHLGRSVGQNVQLYLNTHPSELVRPGLSESLEELRRAFPEPAIILEIHEAAVTSPGVLQELRPRLDALNIGLAYDDFGAGQARLLELTEVPPDVIKFDIALVQNLDSASTARQHMVRSLVEMVRNLGVIPLAEGVETSGEADACRDAGFDLAQGFFFGRPAPAEHWLATR